MRHSIIGRAVLTVLLLAFAALAVAQTLKGPVSDKPLDEKWAPSKWGTNDRASSANHTKNSANITRALATSARGQFRGKSQSDHGIRM
jgi:hypothetical protein